ncbi:MAG: TerB family tellurite resistance protein [Tenacibaculum sp.]|nr:TerB family tellurite resistance protein [Tenacibaculum sp.]
MIGYLITFLLFLFVFRMFSSGSVRTQGYEQPKDFETSLLVLASIIIKADGRINQSELDYVRQYFVRAYGKDKANKSFAQFREVIKERISVRQTCAEIGSFMTYSNRLELVKFLFGIAYSDGEVTASEELEIRRIASYMFINEFDYISLRSMYYNQQNRRTQSARYSQSSDYEYEVLGISENASEDEIKKAYRSSAKKYHPDRLQSASEEDKRAGKEMFQKIQSAYEKIKADRGIS